MKRKLSFLRFCPLLPVFILICHTSASVFKQSARFSDALQKGSQWNPGFLRRSFPEYSVAEDNEAVAGTFEPSIVQAPISSHLPSGFSPVTFTSRVHLPQMRADAPIPNKDNVYSYSTAFPFQNRNPHQPIQPVLLQPIIQYIIQIPSHKPLHNRERDLIGDGDQNSQQELSEVVDVEPDSSTSNLSENLIEMMEEASGAEDTGSGSETHMKKIPAADPSLPEEIQKETFNNLMTIIDHMNNVSDADVIVNSPALSKDSINTSVENMLTYRNPKSSSEILSSGKSNANSGGYSNTAFEQTIKSEARDSQGSYSSPNRNIIRKGFMKSNLRSLQPGPEETEEAMSLFSHLSDQILRDMNKGESGNGYEDSERITGDESNGKNSFSSSSSQNPDNDPYFGESSAYYTSYSNQRPPLDSEIYQTLQTILRNK